MIGRIRVGLRFASSLSKGLKRGDFFPASGRVPPGSAPGGSREPRARSRREVDAFVTSTHTLPVPGLARPVEVLHLTDIHVRGPGPWLDALCAFLETQDGADIVALTGDIVTTGWQPGAADQLLAAVPRGTLGRFAVMGNWEHWAGADAASWGARLDRHGITLLRNEARDLGPGAVGGTDDHLAGDADPDAVRAALPAGRPAVLLTHSPAYAPALAGPDRALVLSGHSHGGQVRLPLLGAGWVPMGTGRYVAGWYMLGGTALYVSRGLGWSIAPFRLGCPPEVARIRLVPA